MFILFILFILFISLQAKVVAIDISSAAVELTQQNAKKSVLNNQPYTTTPYTITATLCIGIIFLVLPHKAYTSY